MNRTAIIGVGFGCLILSFLLCAVVLFQGFCLGMERLTSPRPPEKEFWWNMSRYFFFISLLLRDLCESSLGTCLVLAAQAGFYALLLFAPIFLFYRKRTLSKRP